MAPHKSSSNQKVVPQKLRRNERERKRVDQVNQGFNCLRDRVPRQPGCKQKLSKVDTLREAAKYIEYLRSVLGDVKLPPAIDLSHQFYAHNHHQQQHQQQHHHHHHQQQHSMSSSSTCSTSPSMYPPPCKDPHRPYESPNSSFYSDSSYGFDIEESKYDVKYVSMQ